MFFRAWEGTQRPWGADPKTASSTLGQGEESGLPRCVIVREQYRNKTATVVGGDPRTLGTDPRTEAWPLLSPVRRRERGGPPPFFVLFCFFLLRQVRRAAIVGGDPRTLGADPRTAELFVGTPPLTCKQQGGGARSSSRRSSEAAVGGALCFSCPSEECCSYGSNRREMCR